MGSLDEYASNLITGPGFVGVVVWVFGAAVLNPFAAVESLLGG
jgi:hypothetical protein